MEYDLRQEEGRLLEVYDETKPQVTMETGVAGAGHLVAGCMSMEDAVDVRIHQTSL